MANIFVDEQTSRLSVKVPTDADGNIAQVGDTATGKKSVSIKGFVNNGTLDYATDVMDAFLGDIANTNYDTLSAVRYDTAKVGEGQNQNLSVSKNQIRLANSIGESDTSAIISAVPTDTTLSITLTPASTQFFNTSINGRVITFTRTRTGEFNTPVTIKSGEVAGYGSATAYIQVSAY